VGGVPASVQGRQADPQIVRNLTPQKHVLMENSPPDCFLILRTQRDPHRILAKFIRRDCAPSPLGLNQWCLNGSLHLLCCTLRDQRSGTKTATRPEHPGSPLKQLVLPLLDLVWMDDELLRRIDQRLLTLDRGYRHFRLQSRAVVPVRSSSPRLQRLAAVARKIHLSQRFRYPEPPLRNG